MPAIAALQRANHGKGFRAYGLRGMAALIDPFLGVDHAWMSEPTFPPHPHAGFSAVSYVFLDSETGILNQDSIGTHNLIQPGGLHWTAAGRGIVHEEVPAETGKTVHSLQIFVSLPREQQNMPPAALSLEPQEVPTLQMPGAKVRVPVGHFNNVHSPLQTPTTVDMLDISLDDGAALVIPVAAGHCTFVMPIFGAVDVDDQRFALDDLTLPVFQAQDAPRTIKLHAPQGHAKVMIFSGAPLLSTSTQR
ncbi:pirin family protein [Dyella acidisoli]|uniref:Quercetin 2,3-dioxygenase n=1 Tax=Dyella acidisoli TaxID=1867834 RepID=A0ABQ5XII3_9GAMM|nr:pirin family protein [Dyella acidisoli]GLQ91499.1 quercetin 2,3-dioxygenase [Dyella acidisoli]